MIRIRTFIPTLVLLLATAAALAQPSDTITANPKAVKLHRIWTLLGPLGARRKVGQAAGSFGDIDSNELGDFGIRTGTEAQWNIYYGARPSPSATPSQIIPST